MFSDKQRRKTHRYLKWTGHASLHLEFVGVVTWFITFTSGVGLGWGPGPRIPPGACQPIYMFARSLQKRVLREKFQIRWFDGLPFRISTNYMMGSFTIIGYL